MNATNEIIIEEYTKMFESRISAGATENYQSGKNSRKDDCVVSRQKVEQLYKVSGSCVDDHQFKQEDLESVGDVSQVCLQMVFTCLYLARVGRPDILWS